MSRIMDMDLTCSRQRRWSSGRKPSPSVASICDATSLRWSAIVSARPSSCRRTARGREGGREGGGEADAQIRAVVVGRERNSSREEMTTRRDATRRRGDESRTHPRLELDLVLERLDSEPTGLAAHLSRGDVARPRPCARVEWPAPFRSLGGFSFYHENLASRFSQPGIPGRAALSRDR
eukprot:28195-Pelagococcus_subviridis.AAC.3